MQIFFLIALIIGYTCILLVTIYILIHLVRYHHNYGIKTIAALNFLIIFDAVIIYSTLFLLSSIFFFSEVVNLILWKLSIIFGFVSLLLTSITYTFLVKNKKISYFPLIYFISLFGFLIGSLFSSNSIQFSTSSSNITYKVNLTIGIIIVLFQISVIIYCLILSIISYYKARSKENVKELFINVVILSIPIFMYILYIAYQYSIFRNLHIFLLWVNILGFCIMLVKKPEMFLEMTTRIYFINIYHKSGILLYSYEFTTSNRENDSTIWGNILIGINHILSEFVNTKDQIEVLQTENSDIIVNYDEFGFAVVLITNNQNAILKKLMDNFAQEFRAQYKKELIEIQDLNKLINVSDFNETKEIVERHFHNYLA